VDQPFNPWWVGHIIVKLDYDAHGLNSQLNGTIVTIVCPLTKSFGFAHGLLA